LPWNFGHAEAASTFDVVIVSPALKLVSSSEAVIVAEELLATTEVRTVNVAEDDPAGTNTVVGTSASAELLPSDTVHPLAGDAVERLIVAVVALPPTTVLGLTLSELTCGDTIARLWDSPTSATDAPITIDVLAETLFVVTTKLVEVEPAGIDTVFGVCEMPGLLSDTETVMPPAGASPVRLTVAVDGLPPRTDGGERVRLPSVAGVIVKVWVLESVPR